MTPTVRSLLRLTVLLVCLVAPPLLGAAGAGRALVPLLAFPPVPAPVSQAGFSWPVFVSLAVLILALLTPYAVVVRRIWSRRTRAEPSARSPTPYPWWGLLGLALLASMWLLAWTREPWFAPFQHHTFAPLWLGYIVTVNAFSFHRTGRSLITHEPRLLAGLFPLSAAFWWFFEWLNRFVGNWYYVGVEGFSPLEYVLFASVSFATVLPAVLSTLELLQSVPRLSRVSADLWPLPAIGGRRTGWLLLGASAAGTWALAVWPGAMFPLVWVSPLLAVVGVQQVLGEPTAFAPLERGDWQPLLLPPLAALLCGGLWELWNSGSLAHWTYSIPYVQRFHLFEMPALGYAGYLPFGLECLAAASLLQGWKWATGREGRRRLIGTGGRQPRG